MDVRLYQYESDWDSDLTLPYYYKEFQKYIISGTIKQEDLSTRLTKFKQIATKHQACNINNEDLEYLSLQNSIFLKNAKELWNESKRVSDRVRPILAYYAHQQYAAFFIYTLFRYPITSASVGHGLSIEWGEGKKPSVSGIKVKLLENGFFRRLVDTFTIIGTPTAYGSWLPFEGNFCENSLDSRLKVGEKIGLPSIMNFSSDNFIKEYTAKFSIAGPYIDRLLTNFVLLFVASNIARYRPQLWGQVLAGTYEDDAKFNKIIKIVYDRIFFSDSAKFDTFHCEVWRQFRSFS